MEYYVITPKKEIICGKPKQTLFMPEFDLPLTFKR